MVGASGQSSSQAKAALLQIAFLTFHFTIHHSKVFWALFA
jgi:hypothetical protein